MSHPLPLHFEPDFQKKVLIISLTEQTQLDSPDQWQSLKDQWCENLKLWHTPYKACLDFSKLIISSESSELVAPFFKLIKFFNAFHLRKACIYGLDYSGELPIENLGSFEEAMEFLKVRTGRRMVYDPESFRSVVMIENHLESHIVEVMFAREVVFDSAEKVGDLRGKLTTNLMHWHHSWYLLMDVSGASCTAESHKPLRQMLRFLEGFFMGKAFGYGKRAGEFGTDFPMKIFRTKHQAMVVIKKLVDAEASETADESCTARARKS